MDGYNLDDEIIEAISQKGNLVMLHLHGNLESNLEINLYPISNLKNLEHLDIDSFVVTNNFMINLNDNSKSFKYLSINGFDTSNVGILAFIELDKLFTLKTMMIATILLMNRLENLQI